MLVALAVNATVWHVSPTSSDAEGDHSTCNIYRTLKAEHAQSGDTVLLADGEYDETQSIYLNNAVVIMAAEGAHPVIKQASYFKLLASAKFIGIKFEHNAETNGYCMYFQPGCSRLELQDCEITNFKETCMMSWEEFALNELIINNCYIHDNTKSAIYDPSGCIANTVITNSTFANNDVSPWSAGLIDIRKGASGDPKLTVDHCTFYHNLLTNTDYGEIRPRGLTDVLVSNCIFAQPEDYERVATRFSDNSGGGTVRNVITHHYTKRTNQWGHYDGATLIACSMGDPLFVNAAEGNYTLGEGSPAIDYAGKDADGNDITVTLGDPRWAPSVAPAEPQTLYLKPGVWNTASAKFAIWDITHSAWSEFMTLAENETDIYTATVPADAAKVIFVRLNSDATAPDWDKKWSQTEDLDLVVDNDLFTITAWGSEKSPGAWSKYAPAVGCDWDNLSWIAGSNNKLKVCLGDPAPSVVSVQNPHWSETTEDGIYMTFPAAAWGDISLPASKYEKQGAGILLFVSAFDLKYTDVSIVESNVEYNFTVYNADGADVVYNVAGEPETVFGSTWNTYANKMTLEEGIYKLEKTELLLTAGTIAFKVVKNHDWATSWPSSNYVLNVAEDGIYTVTISYNPEGNVVNATATKTGEAVVRPVVKMHGNFFGEEWEDSEAFAEATDMKSASLTLTLAKGSYKFGMKFDGSWTSNGVAFTRANPSAQVVTGEGDLTLAADVAGDYTFTWTYETNTLSIAYPVKYYEYATGHLNNPDFGDASGRILLTLSKSGNDIVVTIKNNNAKGNPQTGLNFLQVSAVGATTVTYGSHETENTETVSVKVKFDAPKDSYTFSSIHWAYAGFGGEWAIDGLTVPASQICELEDGYYLVGTFGGVEAWDLDDLSAEKRFEANPSTDGEYMLTATLAENDNLKVVKVINDAYGPWYPATDPNYVVGAGYVGEKTIYFRPNGDGGEGWHYGYIYIAPNTPTAIDNNAVDNRAVKCIKNGMLFIQMNGKTYNVLGEVVE